MRMITIGDTMHVHGGLGEKVDYTARVSVRMADEVNAEILKEALEKTQRRYPYLCVRIRANDQEYYYEDNPLPVVLLHTDDKITLNAAETNYHVWAVCYFADHIHLDCYHGITDGTGMYEVLATLLHYYCEKKYGVTDPQGIRLEGDAIPPEELADPQELLAMHPSEAFAAGAPSGSAVVYQPAFTLSRDAGLTPSSEATLWDIEIPESAFIRFTTANDASPGTMVSLLFARALDFLYPARDKEIISAYVINARPMLGAVQSYHNCLSMALFDYSDKLRGMPFQTQCTVYRGMTFIQSDEDRIRPAMEQNAKALRAAMEQAKTLEEKEKVFGQMFSAGDGLVSFLVSYTGKWKYTKIGQYMREFWAHPPNTFDLMVEIGACGGKIFLTVQQRFQEDTIREAFLKELEANHIPYEVKRVMKNDVAAFGPVR